MSNAREIKSRMESVADTEKMLDAMYMLASNKFNSAKREFGKARMYFDALNREIAMAVEGAGAVESVWLRCGKGVPCFLVVSADRGFSGSYSHNIEKCVRKTASDHPEAVFLVVGDHGREAFIKQGINVDRSFRYSPDEPTLHTARKIAEEISERIEGGEFSELSVIYTDYKAEAESKVTVKQLVPFTGCEQSDGNDRTVSDGGTTDKVKTGSGMTDDGMSDKSRIGGGATVGEGSAYVTMEYYPSPTELIEGLMFPYLVGFVYCSLMLGYCCEQSSRMAAMDQAVSNADDMIKELTTEYRRIRQNAVTVEITEISAGVKALKNAKGRHSNE